MARSAFFTMSLMVLVACGGPSADMPVAEARGVLEDFARGRAPADACTSEGRALLRTATRSYSKAMAEQGQPWPDMFGMIENEGASISDVDLMVLAAVGTGFIEPSDLRGPVRQYTQLMSLGYGSQISDMRRAVREACHEVLALQQAAARYTIDLKRYEAAEERAERRGGESASDASRRRERIERAGRHMQRLVAALEAKLEENAER
jgi:hypothetical protein